MTEWLPLFRLVRKICSGSKLEKDFKRRITMATTTAQSVVIYLVRNDLRLHDNECLTWAQLNADVLVPLFCFDSNNFGRTASTWHYEFPKTGVHRTKFVLQSVANFQDLLRDRGSDLVVRNGQTITTAVSEIIQLCQENSTGGKKKIALTFQKEITKEETDVEAELLKLCQEKEVEVKTFWGLTLYHLEDLPFTSIRALPDHYTAFRKQVESHSGVRQAVPSPETLKPMPEFIRDRVGVIPSLKELTSNSETLDTPDDARSAFPFVGGETAALERVERYLWGTDNVSSYKETRNGLVGAEYSTKFSPWLALGCLSPRKIYERIKKYEKERQKNDSTYWVIFELIWRDYFKFVSLKYGDKVFFLSGIMGKKGLPWKRDMTLFDRWRYGKTGVPFVDANMRELLLTGWMSNRGRQNVASFLVKDLGLDWRLGAEWFESLLVDHDVCSNYGNWNYSAGIGNDPRDARKFNMIKQALDYDPEGEYVRLWVPELAGLKGGKVHAPWTLSSSELKVASVNLGESYPRPITVQTEWSRHYSKLKGARWNERTPKRGIDFYFKSATGSSR